MKAKSEKTKKAGNLLNRKESIKKSNSSKANCSIEKNVRCDCYDTKFKPFEGAFISSLNLLIIENYITKSLDADIEARVVDVKIGRVMRRRFFRVFALRHAADEEEKRRSFFAEV